MNSSPGKATPLYFKLLIAFTSVLVSLVAAELFARLLFNMEPARLPVGEFPWMEIRPEGLRLVPDTHRDFYARINGRTIRLNINSLGFRGPEVSSHKLPGGSRILFLGDSITFGPGLEYHETIPARLGRFLGPRVEVINAGVPGMSIKDEVDLLAERVKMVAPDLVLLGFYMNDISRSIVIEEEYGDLGDFWVGLITRARRSSALFNRGWKRVATKKLINTRGLSTDWVPLFHERAWVFDSEVYDKIIELAGDDFGAAWKRDAWPAVESEIRRMKMICDRRGTGLGVVIFPVSIQVESEIMDDFPQRQLARICREHGLPMLDLLPVLREKRAEQVLYDQCHYTPKGAAIAARAAAEWIYQEGLIK